MSSLGREEASLRRRAAVSLAAAEVAMEDEVEAARRLATLRFDVLPVPVVVLVVLVGAGTMAARIECLKESYATILKCI